MLHVEKKGLIRQETQNRNELFALSNLRHTHSLECVSSQEAERVAAAYGLGRSGALDALIAQLDCCGHERLYRAAIYGLGAAGDVAVPALLAALDSDAPIDATGRGRSEETTGDRPLYRKEKIIHALGHAAIGPGTVGGAMTAISQAAQRAWIELAVIVDAISSQEMSQLVDASVRGLRGCECCSNAHAKRALCDQSGFLDLNLFGFVGGCLRAADDGKVFHSIVPEDHRCARTPRVCVLRRFLTKDDHLQGRLGANSLGNPTGAGNGGGAI